MQSLKVHKDYTVTPKSLKCKSADNPLVFELPDSGCTMIFDNPPGGPPPTGNGQTEFDYSAGTKNASIQFVTGKYSYCIQAYRAQPPCTPKKFVDSSGNTIQVSDSLGAK